MSVQDLIDHLRDPETGNPRSHTLAWELHIAGLGELVAGVPTEWRWASSPAPADSAGVKYFDATTKVSGYKAQYDGLKGIVSVGGTKVELLFETGRRENHVGELCRTRPSWQAILAGTLYGDTDPPFDLPIARGFEHFDPAGGLFHMGCEAFHYESVDAMAETVRVVARGILGTQRQNHVVEQKYHRAPRIHPEPIDWTDRPATLWKTALNPDGSRMTDKIEHAAGYLVGMAGHDEEKAWLTITPWLGALERKLGDAGAKAGLIADWKVFGPDDPGRVLRFVEGYGKGKAYYAPDARYEPLVTGFDTMRVANTEAHEALFDFDAPPGSGREGKIKVLGVNNDETYRIAGYDRAIPGQDDIIATRDFVGVFQEPNVLVNAECEVVREIDLSTLPEAVMATDGSGAFAIPWPAAVISAINTQLRPRSANPDSPNYVAGHQPGFLNLKLIAWQDPKILSAQQNAHAYAADRPDLHIRFGPEQPDGHNGFNDMWYGIDLAAPDDPRFPTPTSTEADPRWPADRTIPIGRSTHVRIRSVKAGWWQTGQTWLHVDLGEWPLPLFLARVRSQWGERMIEQMFVIDDVRPAADLFPGVPGHLLRVRDREQNVSVGDELLHAPVVTVEVAPLRPGQPIPELMLSLLTSVDGRETNGEYDVYPYGGAVPLEAIDVESFLTFPRQDEAVTRRIQIDAGRTLRETLVPLGQFIGAVMVPYVDQQTGRRRIRLQRAGAAAPHEDAEHIDDGHWMADVPVIAEPDRRTMTGIKYRFNHDIEGEPQGELTIIDGDQVSAQRGRERPREEDLRGVELPDDPAAQTAALLPPTLARTAVYGRNRQVIRGRVPHAKVGHLDVGAEVRVGHDGVHDPTGVLQLLAQPGRIIEMEDAADDGYTGLAVEVASGFSRPMAPSLRLIDGLDAVTCRVERHRYALKVNPRTGAEQRALDLFRLGQRVRISPRGSRTAILRRIVAIDREADLIVFDGGHFLIGPQWGTVDIPSYTLADPLDQMMWAFFGRGHQYV